MKLLNFENWSNVELSKLGIIYENKVIQKLILSDMSITKNVLLNTYFSMNTKF